MTGQVLYMFLAPSTESRTEINNANFLSRRRRAEGKRVDRACRKRNNILLQQCTTIFPPTPLYHVFRNGSSSSLSTSSVMSSYLSPPPAFSYVASLYLHSLIFLHHHLLQLFSLIFPLPQPPYSSQAIHFLFMQLLCLSL